MRYMLKSLLPVIVLTAVPLFAAPRVWFIHDLAKVNPQTGAAYEAGNLYATRLPAGYRDRNGIWDKAAKTVKLKGLRDEVVAFQIVVESDTPLSVNKISLDAPKGPSTFPVRTEIFREWFLNVTLPSSGKLHYIFSFGKGWYPGPLIPMAAPDLKPEFAWPVKLPCPQNRIDGQKCVVFWADLHISPEARPGTYTTLLRLLVNEKPIEYRLELQVGKDKIPSENHSNFTGISQNMRVFYNHFPEVVKDVNFMFHAHRIDIDGFNYYPPTEGRGKAFKIIWNKRVYDDALHIASTDIENQIVPYLRAETYTAKNGYDGPCQGVAPGWISLPLQVGLFLRAGIEYGTPEYDESFMAACRQVKAKFDEWKITQKHMLFTLKGDEPKDLEKLNINRHHAMLLARAKKEFGLECNYRVDIGGIGSGKGFNPAWTRDSLIDYFQGNVALWNVNAGQGAFNGRGAPEPFHVFRERRPLKVWVYASNTSGEPTLGNNEIDAENIGIPIWHWAFYRYRMDGGMFWEAIAYPTNGPGKQWSDPLFAQSVPDDLAYVNGDCANIYPGCFVFQKSNRPVSSTRLKLIRRGSQDYEYFWLLTEKRKSRALSDSIITSVMHKALWETDLNMTHEEWGKHIKGTLHPEDPEFKYMHGPWSHNPDDWHAARMRAFEAIETAK